MSFSSLGLTPQLLPTFSQLGYESPTPIQSEAIPAILAGRDVMGIAKTGSGKTASFVAPIIHQLASQPLAKHRQPTVLVLVPTRELAEQVQQVFVDFAPAISERLICRAVYGGVSINRQMQAVSRVNVLVATPGRLIDLVGKNAIKLDKISTLVIDEADKLLNLGFRQEIEQVLEQLPAQRQNLLFSATMAANLEPIHESLLNEPAVIKIAEEPDEPQLINQLGYFVTAERKGPLLRYLIKKESRYQVLVFASSGRKVEGIVDKLRKNKIQANAIHGDMSQSARRESLRRFKSGQLRVLVSTDLLGRGIDIDFLPCVINYELPRSPKDYIHRIGRTGRAEAPGDALSLITMDELPHFRVIQKKMKMRVTMQHTDELDLHGY